jgi:SAM-dependent methyltransferase
MTVQCPVTVDHGQPRYSFNKSGFDIYTCPSCGCIIADTPFVAEQYESDSYYTLDFTDRAAIDEKWGFRWRYILKALQRHVKPGKLLDIGAGNGYFVYLAKNEFGWQADGFETSEAESDFARKMFDVHYVDDLAPVGNDYQAVTAFNVLEHVSDPQGLLADMAAHLSPGGYLVLTTPNPGSIQRRVKGLKDWHMVMPPHHINLFTKPALQALIEQSGFEIVSYATLSTYINPVNKLDTDGQVLRKAAFGALKTLGIGADHFAICRRAGDATRAK